MESIIEIENEIIDGMKEGMAAKRANQQSIHFFSSEWEEMIDLVCSLWWPPAMGGFGLVLAL